MNLYQLYFTRTGKQELDAGWKIISASEGISKIASEDFKGIASNLIEMKKQGVPQEILDIQFSKNFVFISGVNMNSIGMDSRGVAFAHGYIVNANEYYETCKSPEKIFGMKEGTFKKEFEGQTSLPVLNDFEYDRLDLNTILQRYGITEEQYEKLVISAILAIEKLASPLCIKTTRPLESYMSVAKDLMYCIMCGLPYHLRVKANVSSFCKKNGTIFLSSQIENDNYFDLESTESSCKDDYITKQPFWQLMLQSKKENKLDECFAKLAEFIDTTYGMPIEVSVEQLNIACQYAMYPFVLENNLDDTLSQLLSVEIKKYDIVDTLLSKYLILYIKDNKEIADIRAFKIIQRRFLDSTNEQFLDVFCKFYAYKIIKSNDKNFFGNLYNILQKRKQEYYKICDYISKINPGYYEIYFVSYFIPHEVKSIPELRRELENSILWNNREEKRDIIIDCIMNMYKKVVSSTSDFMKQSQITKETIEFIDSLVHNSTIKSEIYKILWNSFSLDSFDIDNCNLYKDNYVTKSASLSDNAAVISRIVNIYEDTRNGIKNTDYFDMFFTDRYISKDALRDFILKQFSNKCLKSEECREIDFDIWLGSVYSNITKRFNVVELVNIMISNRVTRFLEPYKIKSTIECSDILKNRYYLNIFKETIHDYVNDKEHIKDKSTKTQILMKYLSVYDQYLYMGNSMNTDAEDSNVFYKFVMICGYICAIAPIIQYIVLEKDTLILSITLGFISMAFLGSMVVAVIFDGFINLIDYLRTDTVIVISKLLIVIIVYAALTITCLLLRSDFIIQIIIVAINIMIQIVNFILGIMKD